MRDILLKKLHDHLLKNYLDMLVPLQQAGGVTAWLEDRLDALEDLPEVLLAEGKPVYIVEEVCMAALTRDLPPSRFNYLSSVLETEFEREYYQWQEMGILTYEIINLIEVCMPVFVALGFSKENEEDQSLRYAIIGTLQGYLVDSE